MVLDDLKHKELWQSVYLFDEKRRPNVLIHLGLALGLTVGTIVFSIYSYGKNTPAAGQCYLNKLTDPHSCTVVPLPDTIDMSLKWNVWIQWGFWLLAVGAFLTLASLVIGFSYAKDWAKVIGVFYHITILFYGLATAVWYVFGPFLFMDPIA